MTKKEYDAKRYQEKKAQILAQSKAYYEKNKEAIYGAYSQFAIFADF